ncbi:NAD-dependent epimerase/dehydratase family protein [Mongoliimonas terrestris]|uniref:NAD-dependent epimerase/dehydratase family protein n=1 Tax=Mongoliimonas terrestris TaxID=1709001 RepID=UPI0009499344|nr:NAD-dependent epimerase/dehydratase family protein [Mongoliimonas terrestris]
MTAAPGSSGPVAVVGGAGFIGSNLADSYLSEGHTVIVADNLSRPGVGRNLAWLQARHGERLRFTDVDVRDAAALAAVLRPARAVFHLAAQVAVTTSLDDPRSDFDVNAAGTLNVLEAVRAAGGRAPVIFASTNKVYGGLHDVAMESDGERHRPSDPTLAARGLPETRGLDFHTPYGCSKGVADQYVLDYARSFGLKTAVLRMSCIYGPRQFGTEDQGWVAHFLIKALAGEPITVFGDGRQVRDVLHVADAVAAYRRLLERIDEVSGTAFNLGGGPRNAVSLRDVLAEIRALTGREVPLAYETWRTGDQLWFVADTGLLERTIGWTQTIGWRDGLADLARWLAESGTAAAPAGRPDPAPAFRRLMA